MKRIGALEGGGTKMVMAIYQEDGTELDRKKIPTEAPAVTIPQMRDYFAGFEIDALGVGCFGPLDLNPSSPAYGYITSTPKLAWKNVDLLGGLLDGKKIPVGFDTDVNAAAIAELELGAAKGCHSCVYVTIGTGIGGGIVVDGCPVHGLLHPEVGHMLLCPQPEDPIPEGVCPYHQHCLEGLASGTALQARCTETPASELPDDHPFITLEANYLAQMCHNLIVTLSPEKIILGGGVMTRAQMLPAIRRETLRLLNGYVQVDTLIRHIDQMIITPALYPVSGLVGAYLLGKHALEDA